ncbi:MAG TPA: hypothetical protein VFT70_06325 [Nocardioides sp.]|nr:hypothetical protein [Nocardioides sp.]
MKSEQVQAPARRRSDRQRPPARQVVDFARRAPSIHNTQPWLWRARGSRLELYADRTRQLPVTDPDGRNLLISCGAALEYARVAAAALGWPADTEPGDPRLTDHLATLRLRPGRSTPADRDAYDVLRHRYTDRRRFTSWPIPTERLDRLTRTGDVPGMSVVPVTTSAGRIRVELVAREAHTLEQTLPGYGEEQRSWIERGSMDGVPAAVLPTDQHRDRRPSRYDGNGPGSSDDIRSTDGVLVLCSTEDGPEAWLRTGELLCRVWVRASQEGLSVVPLSQPVEIDRTRETLQEILGGGLCPQLVVRVGWQEIARSQLPPTPRRPLSEVLLH